MTSLRRNRRGLKVSKPEFPCTRCVDGERCRPEHLFVDCSALDAYKKVMAKRRLEMKKVVEEKTKFHGGKFWFG